MNKQAQEFILVLKWFMIILAAITVIIFLQDNFFPKEKDTLHYEPYREVEGYETVGFDFDRGNGFKRRKKNTITLLRHEWERLPKNGRGAAFCYFNVCSRSEPKMQKGMD